MENLDPFAYRYLPARETVAKAVAVETSAEAEARLFKNRIFFDGENTVVERTRGCGLEV